MFPEVLKLLLATQGFEIGNTYDQGSNNLSPQFTFKKKHPATHPPQMAHLLSGTQAKLLGTQVTNLKVDSQVVVEPTHLKNMLVKLDHFPKDRDENKTYLKPPPRFHV